MVLIPFSEYKKYKSGNIVNNDVHKQKGSGNNYGVKRTAPGITVDRINDIETAPLKDDLRMINKGDILADNKWSLLWQTL